jgi:Flp pilus assembly protein TadB
MRPGPVSGSNRGCPGSTLAADGGSLEISAPPPRPERNPITMLALIIFIVLAIVALIVFSAVVHVLFSPWLLLVAVGIVVWVKFGSRRSRR